MSNFLHEERLLIDGKLVEASGGRTYENVNPATEEVIGVAADASPEDIDRAIAAARRAFDETDWSRDHALRARCIRQLQEAYQEQPRGDPPQLRRRGRLPDPDDLRPGRQRAGQEPRLLRGLPREVPVVRGPRPRRSLRHEGAPLDRARARGRRRRDHRLELPPRAEPQEGGLGTRVRLHRGAQGRSDDAVVRAPARPLHPREHGHPAGCRQRDHLVAERHRRADHRRPARRHDLLHRLDGGGPRILAVSALQ